jgi:large subunit ribosomal protein L31
VATIRVAVKSNNIHLLRHTMKKDIHPELHEVNARCACGNSFMTRSTSSDLRATLCSKCHPFFTGQQKFIDTAGRIEKFNKKYASKKA